MSRRLSLMAALAAVLLVAPGSTLLDALFAQASNGRVTGSVKLTLASTAPSSAAAYEPRSVGPRPKPQPELRNVVIFFSDLPAAKSAAMRAMIAQKDEQFVPHVVAVTVGSSLAFPSEDPFFHNVLVRCCTTSVRLACRTKFCGRPMRSRMRNSSRSRRTLPPARAS